MSYGTAGYAEVAYTEDPVETSIGSIVALEIQAVNGQESEATAVLVAAILGTSEESMGCDAAAISLQPMPSATGQTTSIAINVSGSSEAALNTYHSIEVVNVPYETSAGSIAQIAGFQPVYFRASESVYSTLELSLSALGSIGCTASIASFDFYYPEVSQSTIAAICSIDSVISQPPPANIVSLVYGFDVIESQPSAGSIVTLAEISTVSIASIGSYSPLVEISIVAWPSIARVAYVMNTKTAELTQYTNFDFKNIIRIEGQHFGIKTDGLYKFGGTTDNGTAIDARLVTHEMDFSTNQLKNIPTLWIDSDEQTYFKAKIDQVDSTEQQAGFGGHKTKLSRGAVGRWWQYQIRNVAGGAMRINFIESVVEVLKRRI